MAPREELRRRAVEPGAVRVLQWRGDLSPGCSALVPNLTRDLVQRP